MSDSVRTWTASQRKAIESQGCSVLISAGAGSGKTAVLTERIITKIKNGADIRRIAAVTFSKAAANDLKDKIYKSLSRACADDPQNKRLKAQLSRINGAPISTVHSFCLGLIKRNFAVAGVPVNLRTGDDAEIKRIKKKAAEETLNQAFEKGDEDFYNLVGNFDKEKSDEDFLNLILKAYDTLRSYPNYKSYMHECASKYERDYENAKKNGVLKTFYGNILLDECRKFLSDMREEINSFINFASLLFVSEKDDVNIQGFDEWCENSQEALKKDYNAIYTAFENFSIPKGYFRDMDKDDADAVKLRRDNLKGKIKWFKSKYLTSCEEDVIKDIQRTAKLLESFAKVLDDFDRIYSAYKKESRVADYEDLEHSALNLLTVPDGKGGYDPSPVALSIRESFDEVYVDEYQDTSRIQEEIFKAISKENNRFSVGDTKQSIYGFRSADPKIFINARENYERADNKNEHIYLRENFRCAENIIEFVNSVFSPVYTKENTGTDYEGREALIFGREKTEYKKPVTVAIYPKESDDKASETIRYEADYVAREIKRIVEEETLPDGEKIQYSDIAILTRSSTGVLTPFINKLKYYGIPYKSPNSERFIDRPEIELVISVLRATDDPSDDISTAAAMRSPVWNFTADDLANIRKCARNNAFFDSIRACASVFSNKNRQKGKSFSFSGIIKHCRPREAVFYGLNGREIPFIKPVQKEITQELSLRCRDYIRDIKALRRISAGMTGYNFILYIYEKFGLMSLFADEKDGDIKVANLRLLYNIAFETEKNSFGGLSVFLEKVKEFEEKDSEFHSAASQEDKNSVVLSTIHKSKGLQYKVCFIVNIGKKFNKKDLKAKLIINPEIGAAVDFKDEESGKYRGDLPLEIARKCLERSMICEELRNLYVALTRAKEMLYVVGTAKSVEDSGDDDAIRGLPSRKKFDMIESFADVILHCSVLRNPKICNFRPIDKNIPLSFERVEAKPVSLSEDIIDAAIASLNYVYPYADETKLPAKITVSELKDVKNAGEDEALTDFTVADSDFDTVPDFMREEGEATPAAKGIATHTFMQFCDFERAKDDPEGEIQRLESLGSLTEKQAKIVDLKGVRAFFNSDLYARMKESESLYRERRFTVNIPAEIIMPEIKNKNSGVLLQGVIDCFYKNPDNTYTVADYKTDKVKRDDGEEVLAKRYANQIKCYAFAVEKMTGEKVSRAVIYSFALNKSIEIKL